MKTIGLVLTLLLVSGCLKTRSELRGGSPAPYGREDRTITTQGGSQQQKAQIDSRFFEIDQDFRQLYGKIETLERQVAEGATGRNSSGQEVSQEQYQKLEKRLSTIEEALLSLDKKIRDLPNKGAAVDPATLKGPFSRGEAYFARGQFEKAIESYDEYRRNFPKGQKYADATLKMGLSFQKLQMNQDAKAFYQEVIQRYPKTAVAIKAQENLKSI